MLGISVRVPKIGKLENYINKPFMDRRISPEGKIVGTIVAVNELDDVFELILDVNPEFKTTIENNPVNFSISSKNEKV